MPPAKQIGIRIASDGKAEFKRDMAEIGDSGQAASNQIAQGFQKAGDAVSAEMAKWKVMAAAAQKSLVAQNNQDSFNKVLGVGSGAGNSAQASAAAFLAESAAMKSGLGEVNGALGVVIAGYLGAGIAAGGFIDVIKKSVAASEEEEQSLRRIVAVLQATGGASGQTAAGIVEMADRVSHSTLQTKDDVLNAAAALATFRNVGGDAFGRAIQAAADLSAIFGGDLVSNTEKLGRALDDPIQGMNSLRRSGLDLTASQQAVIRNLQETGDIAGAQGKLLDDLAAKMGGAAAGQHQGLAGAAHDAGQAWHDFLIELNATTGTSSKVASALDVVTSALKLIHDTPALFGDYGPGGVPVELLNGQGNKILGNAPIGPVNITGASAWIGPEKQAMERQDELGAALDQSVQALLIAGNGVGTRQRFIQQKLEEIAKANETTIATIQNTQPDKYKSLVAAAGRDYDSAHADQAAQQAARQVQQADALIDHILQQAADAQKFLDGINIAGVQATNARIAAEDKYQVDLLKDKSGLYAALRKQNSDWLDGQYAAITAEQDKEIAALNDAAPRYAMSQQQIEDARAKIQKEADDKRAAAASEATDRELQVTRQQAEGAKREMEGLFDSIGSDFSNFITQGKYDWKDFGNTAKSILQDIAGELFKLAALDPLKNLLFGENTPTLGSVGGFLGGLFGGSSSPLGSNGSALGSIIVPTVHRGGMAGSASASREVEASIFAGAPRFHVGFDPATERPAILLKSERVLNPQETRDYNSGIRSAIPANLNSPTTSKLEITVKIDGARGSQEITDAVNAGVKQAIAVSRSDLQNYDRQAHAKTVRIAKTVAKQPRMSA